MGFMNKTLNTKCIALGGLLALATIHPAHADEWLETKQGATFFGATAAGVALGGPVGLLGGGLLAAWMNTTMEQAAEAESAKLELADTRRALASSEQALARTEADLEEARASSEHYAQLVLDQLQLEMLFKTGEAELTNTGQLRLAALAEFLVDNPQIAIRLDGFADPRGDAAYNQQLSLGRVSHVARLLEQAGVDRARIASFSHGATRSTASQGDLDAYAMERAVKIQLTQGGAEGIAGID
jgi:outer membrane protein OmpA-like peptidoglycan-associated protein